ncbi:Na+/H+ antiporter NhaC [Pseudidiomarina taiwanensis]|uniref:Na+/H+ antiporter NhaC n=1 Tax=Pseudidiomarina taiwanensis TaxID=337250 RepID=A0A432ZN99_9GAMM|nr:Na+/H+ antiporter NhaC [Pseudidiomarina taiwanensis]RUO79353.1 Na+/H+ antiporter NhaC [Pseudidiomarina taiwanensis]
MQADASKQPRQPTLLQSFIPIILLVIALASSVYLFGDSSSYGPNQIALWIAAAVAVLIGFYNRYTWEMIEDGIRHGVSVALGAMLIILAVGSLIGTWMLSGTVPTMIYYGLELISPSFFYAATAVICGIVALSIGSSWTTAATIGIALMGIAGGLDLSLPITAGAVVSGAYFGDKMSPLSDTTNLAPAVAGNELFAHIRYMGYTTLPAFVIALVVFLILGFQDNTATDIVKLEELQLHLSNSYEISWIMLIPLFVLLGLAAKKKPALPTVFFGAILGAVWALIFQPEVVAQMADGNTGVVDQIKVAWLALTSGFTIETASPELNSLLNRGGMESMMNTIWLIISAMSFGAIMERLGYLERLFMGVLKMVRSTGSLITATLFTCFGANVLTADQYMAIVIPGRIFRGEYERRNIDSRVLSRTLEDSGTLTSALIPWNTCGVFMFSTLAVSPLEYAPYAVFNWLVPLIAIVYAYTGYKILSIDENQAETA